MSFSRRSALSLASVLAAAGSATTPAFARDFTRSLAAGSSDASPGTAQQFRTLVIHRDNARGEHHFATIAIPSPDTAWVAYGSLDAAAWRDGYDRYKSRGYRLRRVDAHHTAKGLRYATIWQLASGPAWEAHTGLSRARFEDQQAAMAKEGYRPVMVNSCETPAGISYAAIFEHAPAREVDVSADLGLDEYRMKLAALTPQGYQPRQISSHLVNGAPRFAVVFEKNAGANRESEIAVSTQAFARRSADLAQRGYQLTDVSGVFASGAPRFSGIWETV